MFLCTDKIFFDLVKSRGDFLYCDTIQECENSKEIKGLVVRLGNTVMKSDITNFRNLKFVATVTTGIDHIDIQACQERSIAIVSLKGEVEFLSSISATPEHTWGLLLALLRHTIPATLSVKNGRWDRQLFFGNELRGKTFGIIGFGRIGKILSNYALAFGMKVIAYDIKKINHIDVLSVDLNTLLSTSEIISINLPLENETKNFVNRGSYKQMKLKPWLINTARGAIVNQQDLLTALDQDLIRGYACDVLEEENSFENGQVKSALVERSQNDQRILITPHIAGSTYESMQSTAKFILEKLCRLNLIPT